jgi:hypothetical protein
VSIDVIAHAAAGPFAAACVVLAFAGTAKIRRPIAVRPAATALKLPSSPAAIRTLGVVEAGAALAGLATGGAAAAAVAAIYGVLALVAWRLLVRAPGTACGCLGTTDTPVTATHVVVNLAAAIAAILATGAGSPLAAVGSGSWSRVAFVLLVGCCAWLVASAFEALPALVAARGGNTR